jgi:hypothetical protein
MKAVLRTRYTDSQAIRMEVRAGEKGKGKVLFAHNYWDNGKASEVAHFALAAWQRQHPEIEVLHEPDPYSK